MLQYYVTWLRTQTWWPKREEGQDLAEYALLLGLIAVVVVLMVTALGDQIKAIFKQITEDLGGTIATEGSS